MSGNFLKKKNSFTELPGFVFVFLFFFLKHVFMFVYVRGGAENGTLFDAKRNPGVCLLQHLYGVLPGDLGQRTEPTH